MILAVPEIERIAVDIPIGLLDAPRPHGRLCDELARNAIGPRRSSVFSAPLRPALRTTSYAEAKIVSPMSIEAYQLLPKIAEVDALLTADLQERVFETHPELAFALLAGEPLQRPKKTAAGEMQRRTILRTVLAGTERLDEWRAPRLRADDALDAAVAAVVAARRALGVARRYPEEPPLDARGLRMEIWA